MCSAGGNAEGLARTFVDHEPPPYCADPTLFEVPAYQPSPSGEVCAAAGAARPARAALLILPGLLCLGSWTVERVGCAAAGLSWVLPGAAS